jgi:hypothetical protein
LKEKREATEKVINSKQPTGPVTEGVEERRKRLKE